MLVALAGPAGAGTARAAQWTISPAASVSESYTTNVDLARGNAKKRSDLITTLSPGVRVRGTGARINFDLNYGADQTIYKKTTDRNDLSHRLNATGTAELYERQLFLDARASVFRQIINPTQATSNTSGVNAINQADTSSWSIGPRFLHHFGPYIDTTSTFTHAEVNTAPTNAANASGALNTANLNAARANSRTNTSTFVAQSGRAFTRFRWSVRAQSSKVGRGDELPGLDTKTLDTNYTYIINRQYALLAGLGWQDRQDATLRNSVRGVTWSVGARLNPGPRTSFTLNYNDRDNSRFFSFDGAYRISSRTSVSVRYDEQLTFSQQQVLTGLGFLGVDPATGLFIDTRTGLPFDFSNLDFALQTQTSRTQTFSTALNGTRGRNTFTARFSHADQNTDLTNTKRTTDNASGTWSRRINRRTTGSVAFNFQRTTEVPGDTTRTRILGSLSLSYRLTPTATAALTANTSRTDSTVNNENTSESSITLTLRKAF